ncbi:DUF2079 domain-containing protein [Actinomadura hibisca]|uniref:DUF2079 domain-containing protein n=1 Tax=Actinomadura hibisca TaxID=68565 RepID=UPI0009FDEBBA|nr:DUF2079 domain-containing protein [Actinomadura hibisca]
MTLTERRPLATPDAAPRPGLPARAPYLLAALFGVLYALMSVVRHLRYETRSWDLGIFDQVVASYARLEAPVSDLKGPGFNILGDHFSPVTALIAPFYKLFPTPVTLLVAQAALLAVSVVPVTRAARRALGDGAGLAVGAAYGLSWGLQRAVDFDFHEICFAVPLVAFSLEAVLRGRWYVALAWALPLGLVKEDLGPTTAAIALVVLLRARHTDRRAAGAALGAAVFGLALCALTLTVLIPAFNGAGGYDYWSKMGDGAGPLAGWDTKTRTLLWLVLPTTGLLALRSPLLIAAIPTLGWRLTSGYEYYWGTDWHYSAVLMPIVSLALVDALPRLRDDARPWLRAYARHIPVAALAVALALSTALPIAALTHWDTYRPTPTSKAGARVLSVIPDGATVEADVRPSAHLTQRCRVFWVGNTRGIVPDYITIYDPNVDREAMLKYAKGLHPDSEFAVRAAEAGFWVLQRTR